MIKNKKSNAFAFVVLLLLSVVFLFPIYLVVMNSFKSRFNIISEPFVFPNSETFVGLENYISGIQTSGILEAFLRTLFTNSGTVVTTSFFKL